MFRIRSATFVRLAFLVTLLIAGCTSEAQSMPTFTVVPDAVKLKLTWTHGITFIGYYIAQERGFYADEGLTVTVEPGFESGELITLPERVVAGEFEFALGSNELVRNKQAQEAPITAITTIVQLSPNAYFARASSGIVTPVDLEGRSIGVVSDQARSYLEQLLATADLTLDDVIVVPVGYDMTPFYEEEVEVWNGYLTNEVIRARRKGLELVTFPLHEYGVEESAVTIFTRQEIIRDNPELAVRFIRGSLRGWQWAVENPTEAVDIMLALYPDLPEDRDFHLASFDALIPLVRPPGVQIGSIDCEAWVAHQALADLESTEGLCTTEIFDAVGEIE